MGEATAGRQRGGPRTDDVRARPGLRHRDAGAGRNPEPALDAVHVHVRACARAHPPVFQHAEPLLLRSSSGGAPGRRRFPEALPGRRAQRSAVLLPVRGPVARGGRLRGRVRGPARVRHVLAA